MSTENKELGPRLPSFSSQEPASPDVVPPGTSENEDDSSENAEEVKREAEPEESAE